MPIPGIGVAEFLLILLIAVAPIVLVVWLLVRVLRSNGRRAASPQRSPLDILQERYARGEIDTAEYEERLRHLKQSGG